MSAYKISSFSKKEISELFAHAKAVKKSQELVILTTPALLCPYGKILLITSRKVGNAPERNLLRRRSKAIFYEARLFEKPINLALIFRPPATKLSFEQLKAIILQAHHKGCQAHGIF